MIKKRYLNKNLEIPNYFQKKFRNSLNDSFLRANTKSKFKSEINEFELN